MRQIEWKDEDGKLHLSWVRDQDGDDAAPTGILCDPPDVEALDWDAIKLDLHNLLVQMRLLTWKDVQRSQTGLISAILGTQKKRLIELYKLREVENG